VSPSRSARRGGCAAPRRRERVGRAVERQVIQADVVEKGQARDDLVDDLLRDRLLAALELERAEKLQLLLERDRAHLVDGLVADFHVPRFPAQARALAHRQALVFRNFASSSRTTSESVSL